MRIRSLKQRCPALCTTFLFAARAMVDDKETIKLDELDEDEYDALSEEKKEELENLALAKRKERIKRLVDQIRFVSFFW